MEWDVRRLEEILAHVLWEIVHDERGPVLRLELTDEQLARLLARLPG